MPVDSGSHPQNGNHQYITSTSNEEASILWTSSPALASQNSIYTIDDSSQLQLAPTSEDANGTKTKLFEKTSKKHLETFLIFTILIISILLIALCVTIYLVVDTKLDDTTPYICLSHQCIRTASTLLSTINKSENPCDNFYNFVCGGFRTERAAPNPSLDNNWYMIIDALLKRDLTDFLLQNDQADDPEFVQKGRTLYKSCIDFDAMEVNGYDAFWDILNKTGLPKDPIGNPLSAEQWLISLAKILRYAGFNIILGVSVTKSISNSSTNQIMISTPDDAETIFTGSFRKNKKFLKASLKDDAKSKWVKSVGKMFNYVNKSGEEGKITDELKATISMLIYIRRSIHSIKENSNISKSIHNEIPEEMSIEELQAYLDESTKSGKSKVNLAKYISTLYEDIEDVEIDFNNTKLLVFQKNYFQILSKFLEHIEDKDIGIYIWWIFLENMAPHINRDLSDSIHNFWSSLSDIYYSESRLNFCLGVVSQLMAPSSGFFVIDKIENKTVNKIMALIDQIKNVFAEEIWSLSWMDNDTKRSSIEKLNEMSSFVGIPEIFRDAEEINNMYNITLEEDTYLTNFLSLIDLHTHSMFASIAEVNNVSFEIFDPLDVNAYYNPSNNSITVPAGILHFPFYHLGIESLIYGAIGTVIGHEITHGFDSIGRKYDKFGNVHSWWSNRSIDQYTNRTYCFEEQYSSYVIPSLNATVDGEMTLSENLADDGGLKFAYRAYKQYEEIGRAQPKLPGLHEYSDEQLFFLAYANSCCSDETDVTLTERLNSDEHSPDLLRVNVPLQNFGRFAEVWNCPIGSKMNPAKKCSLWN